MILVVIMLIVIGGGYALINSNQSDQNTSNGDDTGDDFSFTSLDGSQVHLSDYRGKIVILDMWATWCSPCQFQMTELKKIYDYYTRDELEIFSVDVSSETIQQVQDFKEQFKTQLGINLNWIFGIDDGSVWQKYMINGGIPTLCIFDQDGNLQFEHEGVSVFSEIPQGWPQDTPILGPKIDAML